MARSAISISPAVDSRWFDEPSRSPTEWLIHVDAGVLKVKLATAIIGISSIHLLRTFIEAGRIGAHDSNLTYEGVMWQTIIRSIFILSAIGIAYVDKMSQQLTVKPPQA